MAEKMSQIIDRLFSVGAHFGYGKQQRHPSQAPVIFGAKGGVELIDLSQTAQYLEEALAFVEGLAKERKTILFVGGKPEAREAVRRVAERLGQPYVASRWIGGTLTNFSEIKKRLNRLADLFGKRERGELAQFTKKERLLIDREIENLEVMFGGIKMMQKLPDALVIIDPRREEGANEEARQLGIPTVALLNTDCDRRKISFPIPGNDASRHSIALILDEIGKRYEDHLSAERPAGPVQEA